MNYLLEKIRIEEKTGSRIKFDTNDNPYASKILKADAVNPIDELEPHHKVTIFDEGIIASYADVLPKGRGGNLPDDESWSESQIPLRKRVFAGGMMMEYDLGAKYCQKYSHDIIDENGVVIPGKSAGDLVKNSDGTVKTFSRIMIFVRQTPVMDGVYNEMGEPEFTPEGRPVVRPRKDKDGNMVMTWVKGWSPAEVGENYRRLYVSYEQAVSQSPAASFSTIIEPDETKDNVVEDDPIDIDE